MICCTIRPSRSTGELIRFARSLQTTDQICAIDRLKVSTSKAIQNLPSEKRDGADVSYATYRQLISDEVSSNVAMNLLNRAEFLPAFLERLKSEPEKVVKEFEVFRNGRESRSSLSSPAEH